VSDNITAFETSPNYSIVFLLGPPGVGKSTFGSRACQMLGLRFLDLAGKLVTAPVDGNRRSVPERITHIVADRGVDVVELPWEFQHDRRVLALVRKLGVPLLLWAHPEDMQARSGRDERLFTPVPRLKIRGGFGRNGIGCREFRHLNRACGNTLILVDLPLEDAAEVVQDAIAEIREESESSPAEREGLVSWVEDWRSDHNASVRVSKVIVDAMARYLSHLRAHGNSPRTLSFVRSDLNAAGHLVWMYGSPKGKRILEYFDAPPWELEFKRKFTDSPNLVARYCRSLEGFARFLKECGDLPKENE
jgi:hypothetical protein